MRLDASFYTFAHEIGHNLGCNHAADQGLVPGHLPIRMAGGLLVETGRNTGRYCPIRVYLMNVGFHFSPIHTRAVKSAAVVGAFMADNARTINQTTATVAGYR